ncbi:transporter [Streptomyces caatingaensis]|uniref:Transporter n=1 Tax=Streptomyces caatingaensis TaxID=1678637 RepID=A0A0K9XH76_9ACTN|nr:transporter [Streptomyces caatingaensis]
MVAVAGGTFSVVTTEMLPVGLLSPVGTDLGVSDGTAGLTMTVPGLVAAAAAPLVTGAAGRLDRRWLLVALMGLLAAANFLAAAAPSIAVLVGLRVLVGVSIGGVWAVAAGLGARLVPARSAGAATSVVFSGIAVASVLGVPAGTLVGGWGGWRAAFAVMGAVASVVTVVLAVLLPPLPAGEAASFRALPRLLRGRRVRLGLLIVLLLVSGHFAGYTFVRPVLERLPGADSGTIGALMLAYGVAGVGGNFLAGTAVTHRPRVVLVTIAVVLGAVVPTVSWVSSVSSVSSVRNGTAVAAGLLVVWGLAYGGVSVSTQTWLTAAAPEAREAASALFVAVFNVAISVGALLGGRAVDAVSLSGALWLGGLLALAAVVPLGLAGRGRANGRAAERRRDPSPARP